MKNLLTEDELKWIEANQERCQACGHLLIFEESDCCQFCIVGGCFCRWGNMPDNDVPESTETEGIKD